MEALPQPIFCKLGVNAKELFPKKFPEGSFLSKKAKKKCKYKMFKTKIETTQFNSSKNQINTSTFQKCQGTNLLMS